jgi:hypothetical protein
MVASPAARSTRAARNTATNPDFLADRAPQGAVRECDGFFVGLLPSEAVVNESSTPASHFFGVFGCARSPITSGEFSIAMQGQSG